jgi:hypothetical protein
MLVCVFLYVNSGDDRHDDKYLLARYWLDRIEVNNRIFSPIELLLITLLDRFSVSIGDGCDR